MRYREMRLPCDTEVTATLGGEMRRVRFANISSTGARIEGLGRVPREVLVTLSHLGTRVTARVVWSNDRQTGLRFTSALSNVDLNALRGVGGGRGAGWGTAGPHAFRELT